MEEEDDGEYLPNADSDLDDEDLGYDYEDGDDEEAYLRGAVPPTGNTSRSSHAVGTLCERVALL